LIPYVLCPCSKEYAIEIGPNCFIGAGSTVMHGVSIGYGSVVGAATVVNKDIPPMSLVVGNPGRVVKRFSMKTNSWISIEEYSSADEMLLPGEEQYLKILKDKYPAIQLPCIAGSKFLGDI